jgi:hypothetical protein
MVVDQHSDTLATDKSGIVLNVFAGRRAIQLQVGSDGNISYDKNRQEPEPK